MDKCPECGQDIRVLRRDLDMLCIFGLGTVAWLLAMGLGLNFWLTMLALLIGMFVGSRVAVSLEESRSKRLAKTTH
jgi:hypothetical protein